jgi:hypothetical protein
MQMNQKPNVIFWALILVAIVSVALFVYSLILILTRENPLFTKNQMGDICSLISSTINIFIVSWFFKNKKKEIYGLPGEQETSNKSNKR